MEKIIEDRLNELKSKYAHEIQPKLDKTLNEQLILELSIRIDELEQIKDKL